MRCSRTMLAAAACLCLAAGCAKRQHRKPSSVTVELPTARPADARRGFRLDGTPGNMIEDR